jgi:hypothetical protein
VSEPRRRGDNLRGGGGTARYLDRDRQPRAVPQVYRAIINFGNGLGLSTVNPETTTGVVHDVHGDTFTLSYTSGGQTFTQSGAF